MLQFDKYVLVAEVTGHSTLFLTESKYCIHCCFEVAFAYVFQMML